MRRKTLVVVLLAGAFMALCAGPAAALKVGWMSGVSAPGTPARYDKVGVIKIGPARARNVLVLEPGTSGGAAYFVPVAKWVTSKVHGWQVWAVERRENLLEDLSELNLAKAGRASALDLFNYYLGYLKNPKITHHFKTILDTSVAFAKRWGMAVAVGDLHRVIDAARRLGGKVVLGGHSLGGSVVTAYATWDFHGRAGAADLAGLVYIDGASRSPLSASVARQRLSVLQAAKASPWLSFGGIPAPYAGIFSATGATAALIAPNQPSAGQASGVFPPTITPPVPVTNLGELGYAQNVGTSPPTLAAAQAHLGKGLAATGNPRGWNGAGALTPIKRFAMMFSGTGVTGADGTEWYFPYRLTLDSGAVGTGLRNPAQAVLGVDAIHGRTLPHRLRIYAFGAALVGQRVLDAAKTLARQSGIPQRNLVLINRASTYAHNDPAGAYPRNDFVAHLLPFLEKIATAA